MFEAVDTTSKGAQLRCPAGDRIAVPGTRVKRKIAFGAARHRIRMHSALINSRQGLYPSRVPEQRRERRNFSR
jgi:hypothetical protein